MQILKPNSTDKSPIYQDLDGVLYREISIEVVNLINKISNYLLYEAVVGNKIFIKPATFHVGPSCWSSAQVIDYFEFLANFLQELIKNNFTLIDGHPFNFMYEHSELKFIDFGSFIKFDENAIKASIEEAEGYRCLIKFFSASYMQNLRRYLSTAESSTERTSEVLILEKGLKGLHENDCYISLKERFNRISNPNHLPTGIWVDYRDNNTTIDARARSDPRFTLAQRLIVESGATTAIDIGSNDGLYSITAALNNISVLALEIEDFNSSSLFKFSKLNKLKITTATATLEDYIYHLNFVPLPFRPKINLAMLFAVFHHLVHDWGYTVEKLIQEIEILGVEKIILEFVSYEDVFLSKKTKIDWYSLDSVVLIFQKFGFKSIIYPEHEIGRRLIYLEK
jgi:hypothetical protein